MPPRMKNVGVEKASSKAKGKGKAGPELEKDTILGDSRPLPQIFLGFAKRYNTIYKLKSNSIKIERNVNTPKMEELRIVELFQDGGMGSWVEVWTQGYVKEWVHAFVTHLTLNRESGVFVTNVEGVDIRFTAKEVCEHLNLPMEGIDPHGPLGQADSILEDMYTYLGGVPPMSVKCMYRRQFPQKWNAIGYLLHINVMPRGGRAQDEVPVNHLLFMYALATRQQINFVPVIYEVFKQLAKGEVKVIAYHRLISFICNLFNVRQHEWKWLQGHDMDDAMLRKMRMEAPAAEGAQGAQEHNVRDDEQRQDEPTQEAPMYEEEEHSYDESSLEGRIRGTIEHCHFAGIKHYDNLTEKVMGTMLDQHNERMEFLKRHFPDLPTSFDSHQSPPHVPFDPMYTDVTTPMATPFMDPQYGDAEPRVGMNTSERASVMESIFGQEIPSPMPTATFTQMLQNLDVAAEDPSVTPAPQIPTTSVDQGGSSESKQTLFKRIWPRGKKSKKLAVKPKSN